MTRQRLEREQILAVVPAFNEEKSIGGVVDAVRATGVAVVVVSDGSSDRTAAMARQHGARVLELPINLGVGGALRTGFKFAIKERFEAVVQIDADGQHPTHQIETLIDVANESGADMVIGSRFLNDRPSMSVAGSRRLAMYVLARSASSSAAARITDSTSGFRLIRRPLLDEFSRHFATNYLGDTYEAVVSAGRAGYRIVEVPAMLRDREFGESTASTGSAIRFTLKGLGVALLGLHRKLTPRS